MRVLHVISGIEPENGGPTRALLGLTAAQAKLGLDVHVVSTYRRPSGPANAAAFEASGVRVTMIGGTWGPSLWSPFLARKLRPLIAEADVVHIHALFEEIQHQAARVCRQLRKPHFIRTCGGLDPWVFARGRLKKRLYFALRLRRDLNGATAIHYTTEAERRAAARLGLTARTIVEPNGIDLVEFETLPDRGRFRAKHPQIGPDRPMILFLGRIDYKKGLDVLIPAFARARISETVLVLAGPDSFGYQQQMQQLAEKEGVADQVLFPGMLHGRERIEALIDADLFVLPSYVENFGVAAIEAMASGVSTVLSDGVNIADDARENGLAEVTPTDTNSLASAMCRVLGDPVAYGSRTARARQYALSVYDWSAIAGRWRAHYAAARTSASRPVDARGEHP